MLTLGKRQRSLGSALKEYMGITKDSKYQQADWRQRPLPADMQKYAVMDVMHLHRIKKCLVTELLQKEKLLLAYHKSQFVTLRAYVEKPSSPTKLARQILRKGKEKRWIKSKGKEVNFDVLVNVCEWRDKVAEEVDVSLHALLPDFVIMDLVANRSEGISEASELLPELKKSVHAYRCSYVDLNILVANITPHLPGLAEILVR